MKQITEIRSNIKIVDDCWIWSGHKAGAGYGYIYFFIDGKRFNFYVHRILWMYANGSFPINTEADHLCKKPECVNPYHIEAVTHAENLARCSPRRSLDHCKIGHPLTEDNLYWLKNGHRYCKTCQIIRSKKGTIIKELPITQEDIFYV
jgi:hypothetical protein